MQAIANLNQAQALADAGNLTAALEILNTNEATSDLGAAYARLMPKGGTCVAIPALTEALGRDITAEVMALLEAGKAWLVRGENWHYGITIGEIEYGFLEIEA